MTEYVACYKPGKGKKSGKEERIAKIVCIERQRLGFKCVAGCPNILPLQSETETSLVGEPDSSTASLQADPAPPHFFKEEKEGSMKKIVVVSIKLRNFKGIRSLDVAFNGHTKVYGDNATGKTTIQDGFMWCLFGKDSSNKADFDIKTLDSRGVPAHNLEHSVEVDLLADGKQVLLKKVYSEKYTKKRGSAQAEFTGHTIDHFYDNVPVKEKDYQDRIRQIVDENIFRLITDPRYFNEVLKWVDRRKILMAVCGDISLADVIAANPELARLTEIIGDHSIDDYKKIVQGKKAEINRELEKIPTRIDEVNKAMAEVRPDIAKVPGMLEELWKKKAALESQLADIRNGGALSAKRIELQNVQADIQELKNAYDIGRSERLSPLNKELGELATKRSVLPGQIKAKEATISDLRQIIEAHERDLVSIRAHWFAVEAQEINVTTHCPTCKQAIPEIEVNSARERALNAKADNLADITARGKEKAAKVEEHKASIETLSAEVATLGAQLSTIDKEILDLKERIAAIQAEQPIVPGSLLEKKTLIENEIHNINASEGGLIKNVEDQIAVVNTEINVLHADLQKEQSNKSGHARIEELAALQKALAKEYEELEANLFLIESFIRAKVDLLESTINSKFSLARFKLFEDQINGGLQEVCETTLNGVPYSSINNAGKIQVGMDIIKTMQAHYQITGPVWIDNRESIVELPAMDCQTISLIVSEPDKILRVA